MQSHRTLCSAKLHDHRSDCDIVNTKHLDSLIVQVMSDDRLSCLLFDVKCHTSPHTGQTTIALGVWQVVVSSD